MRALLRTSAVLLLASAMPATVVGEEPAGGAALEKTPWATVRADLREGMEERPFGFTTKTKRELHARLPAAVEEALHWLAAHQSPDGRWEAAGFAAWCNGEAVPDGERTDGRGLALYDVGVTGLALHAFLVAGHDGAASGRHDETVRRGLAYLRGVQDEEGCFGERVASSRAHDRRFDTIVVPPGKHGAGARRRVPVDPVDEGAEAPRSTFPYNHAIATLAMVEAYALTGDDACRTSAQAGLDFLAKIRNPYYAWGYGQRSGRNDTSATAWAVLPLRTAERVNRLAVAAGEPAPLEIDEDAFEGVRSWIDKVTEGETGRVGYASRGSRSSRDEERADWFPRERSEALTAAGVLMRLFAGEDRRSAPVKLGLELCQGMPPVWDPKDGSIDLIYWHFASLAVYHADTSRRGGRWRAGREWSAWLYALEGALLENQRRDGTVAQAKGSWDPVGAWGHAGGRVYATALNTLTLLTPLRFPPLAAE